MLDSSIIWYHWLVQYGIIWYNMVPYMVGIIALAIIGWYNMVPHTVNQQVDVEKNTI